MPSWNRAAANTAKCELEKLSREKRSGLPSGWALAALFGLLVVGRDARASSATEASATRKTSTEARESAGRPRVKLNRLTFPSIPDASYYKNHLARSLQRETEQADWGADDDSVIEYRFRVDRLSIAVEDGLIRVHCAATGELPKNQNATSRLTFSGHPSEQRRLVEKVLSIVARGVITRLAQIEHARRSR